MNITKEQLKDYLTELGFTVPNIPPKNIPNKVVLSWLVLSRQVDVVFTFRSKKFTYCRSYYTQEGCMDLLTDYREYV